MSQDAAVLRDLNELTKQDSKAQSQSISNILKSSRQAEVDQKNEKTVHNFENTDDKKNSAMYLPLVQKPQRRRT